MEAVNSEREGKITEKRFDFLVFLKSPALLMVGVLMALFRRESFGAAGGRMKESGGEEPVSGFFPILFNGWFLNAKLKIAFIQSKLFKKPGFFSKLF